MRWLTLLFLCVSGLIEGQNPFYLTIDKSLGLPSNTVYDIFQDSKGFMWFATSKGLCSYDGDLVKVYTASFQTSKAGSLIKEDRYSRIWYENFDGFLYYVERGVLKKLSQKRALGYFNYGLTQNHLIVMQQQELFVYDLKTLKLHKKILLPMHYVYATYNHHGKLYCVGKDVLVVHGDLSMSVIPLPPEVETQIHSTLIFEKEKDIVITSKFNRNSYLVQGDSIINLALKPDVDFIQNVSTTAAYTWFCTTTGVYRKSNTTADTSLYFKDFNISTVFQDKDDNYWIGTIDRGVLFIDNYNSVLQTLDDPPQTIAIDNNDVIAGTQHGTLQRYNTLTKAIHTSYRFKNNHAINQLFIDPTQRRWYVTQSKFNIFEKEQPIAEMSIAVKEICPVDGSYVAYAASNASGIIKISEQPSDWDNSFNRNYFVSADPIKRTNTLDKQNGKSVAYNPVNKHIYYATNLGLKAVTRENTFTLLYNDQNLNVSKLHHFNGAIYGVTTNNELVKIDANNRVSPIIFSDAINPLQIDKFSFQNELLFLATTNAIYEFNLRTLETTLIISLTSDEEIYDIKKNKDTYYIASKKGLISWPVSKIKSAAHPKLFVSEVLVNNKKVAIKKPLVLESRQNNVSIQFTLLSSIPNKRHSLLYRVNNEVWRPLTFPNRTLLLSSLAPGSYTIDVKVADDFESAQQVVLTVKKPIWLHPLFLLIMVLLLIAVFYFLYQRKLIQIHALNQSRIEKVTLEKNLIQYRLKSIKSQMNPHFFYNALNTLQSFVLANEKREALDYLNKFSSLTRTMLDMSERESITITEEINALKHYLDIEKVRFDNNFAYEIHVQPDIQADVVKIPTLMLQPYVENAIKHGLLHKQGEKKLSLSISKSTNQLKIVINDNGIGRAKSMLLNKNHNNNHKSFATKALQDRVALMNQDSNKQIAVTFIDHVNEQGKPQGTSVILTLNNFL